MRVVCFASHPFVRNRILTSCEFVCEWLRFAIAALLHWLSMEPSARRWQSFPWLEYECARSAAIHNRAMADARLGVSDAMTAHADDSAELQRLANNARRRSRSASIDDAHGRRSSRERRTDEEKASDRHVDSEHKRDARASRSDEAKASARAADAERKRSDRQDRSQEEAEAERLHNSQQRRDQRQQQTDEERAAVR
jgi:hypothetical protein